MMNAIIAAVLTAGTTFAAPLAFSPDDLRIEGDTGSFESELSSRKIEDGLYAVTIRLKSPKAERPPKFSVTWSVPSVDVHGFWVPGTRLDKATYYNLNVTSRAATQAPVMNLHSLGDRNRFTVACSEALRKVAFNGWIKEEDSRFYFNLTFFDEHEAAMDEWTAELRLDLRDVSYYQALNEVAQWWATDHGMTPLPIPDDARRPMYSTWYAFHQTLDEEQLLNECKQAKELGFESIIIDDGWQTLDGKRGYGFTGDWKPERLTEIRQLSDRVHAMGMKILLWYSVPFVGDHAKNHERFKGKYLRAWESQQTNVLDPRYPEVREFITKTYVDAVRDWDLDGLKLDFIDFFTAGGDTVLTAEDGRDLASVNEAVDQLMTDVTTALVEIKPGIMVEFRQAYIGPVMRKFGNMFRAADCPNMALVNRVRTIDLRLLAGDTAVHSDMYMWHPEEPVESAAQQLLNVLFSVPQLSVRLETLPDEHLNMVRFWTHYWNENRETLLSGKLQPERPGANYPVVSAVGAKKTIVALYDGALARVETLEGRELDVVNATARGEIVLLLGKDAGKVKVEIRDTGGEITETLETNLKSGSHAFAVPPSGLLSISRP